MRERIEERVCRIFEFIGSQGYWHHVGMPLNLEARTLLEYMATIEAPPLDSQDPVTARAERSALVPDPTEDCHESRDLDNHDNVCRALTNRSGHEVLSIDDRLAPEAPFPAGLDDCVDATRWAHTHAAGDGRLPHRAGTDRLPTPRLPGGRLSDEHRLPRRERRGMFPDRQFDGMVRRPTT